MDSLFDASLFDAPPLTPEVGPGQLDIFAPAEPDPVPAEAGVEGVSDAGVGVAVDDPAEVAELRETHAELIGAATVAVVGPTDGNDEPAELLNDPDWEPLPAVPDEGEPVDLWGPVVGQPGALRSLQAAVVAPVHAYLLVGPPGSGRRAAARAFAASLLCSRGGCGQCSTCRRALIAHHPDLVEVEREGASISVDQAREIIRLAMRSPVEGERKVLVLVDFHLVTAAAPTLLKIIEEPPPSTVFVVLADLVPPELVTIASRCVRVDFAPMRPSAVLDALIATGASPDDARRAARAAGGRFDRARLLVGDPTLASRLVFWENVAFRVDGSGATASVIAAEALAVIDGAATAPLEARQAAEVAELDDRIELTGQRGAAGLRKELADRHKRELKRVRDDETRFGLSVLEGIYRDRLAADGSQGRACLDAIEAIASLNGELIRNPALALALVNLVVHLPPIPASAP